ncbi:MAG: metal-sulfur cluster assembly factor [Alphaproteobacteria bacterium]
MNDKNLNDFLPNKNSSYYKKLNNNEVNQIISKKNVVDQIKTVMDPEIPVNLYDLGLIYNIDIDSNNNVLINMTLTI